MRQFTHILTLVITTTLLACIQTKTNSYSEKLKIEFETVEFIDINNEFLQNETPGYGNRQLNEKQKMTFVNKCNSSTSVGPIKSMSKYFITVQFKNGTTRKFRGSGQYLKERNDFAFNLGDRNYFDVIWDELGMEIIKNIHSIFENYIEFDESTDSHENKELMSKSLKSLNVVTDKDDLNLLINVWMYYDPTDFAEINEIYRILKHSRPQSIDAVKFRIAHKKDWESEDSAPYSDLKSVLKRLEHEE